METFVVETNERERESVSEIARRIGEGYELSDRGRERFARGQRRRGGEIFASASDGTVERGVRRANERDDRYGGYNFVREEGENNHVGTVSRKRSRIRGAIVFGR